MLSDAIIFHNVVKEYRLDTGVLRFKSFLDRLKNGQLGKKLQRATPFLALDNVSFSVKSGERLGIIGHNGAGKSTILKLIGRISYPSFGSIKVNGTTGGILEVGAGFHPDLSARENILLTSILYGYSKKEVLAVLNEIISVAEVEKFIDVPIKRYSSGMKMKLAFAIAMTTKPDIVLLDEAFSVGDAKFKKKATNMMQSFLDGKTLVLVSHSLAQIREVCQRVIVLNKGKIAFDGNVEEGCNYYEALAREGTETNKIEIIAPDIKRGLPEKAKAELKEIKVIKVDNQSLTVLVTGKIIECKTSCIIKYAVKKEVLGQILDTIDSGALSFDGISGESFAKTVEFSTLNLYPGNFILEINLFTDLTSKKVAFEHITSPFKISGEINERQGIINMGATLV